VKKDTDTHVAALVTLVRAYIGSLANPDEVDWPFLFKRNMTDGATWRAEDKTRTEAAMAALDATGYKIMSPKKRSDVAAAALKELDAD
jgi:hypothetical protein